MKNDTIAVTIRTSDIIDNVDDYFENSFDWISLSIEDICDYNIDFLKSLIPECKRKFLELESVKDQFEYDVVTIHNYAYVKSVESKLIGMINEHIEDTIINALPLPFIDIKGFFDNGNSAKILTFCDYITITFKREDVVKFQRSRDYWDRINYTFNEYIIDTIRDNKKHFCYSDLDASYDWDNETHLKELWNTYNETEIVIDHTKEFDIIFI